MSAPLFVRTGDIVTHCRRDGAASGAPLVFANSLGTDLRVWDALLEHLPGDRPLLRYDQRGHGLSDVTPAPYSIAGLAADLAALLDVLEIRGAVVCGLSVGGMIAQQLAATRPDLVRALVLCDTAHRIGPREMWEARAAAIRAGSLAAIADAVLERWFSAALREQRPQELAGWRNMLVRTPQEGYLGTCAALRDADLGALAAALAVPALCVCGAQDGATPPALVRELAGLIPGARFAVVDGAGHLPCVEKPDTLAHLIVDFLAEQRLG